MKIHTFAERHLKKGAGVLFHKKVEFFKKLLLKIHFFFLGHWAKDKEGYYEHCRWCGQGGTLLGCDDCIESFCKHCIKRNFGRQTCQEIEDKPRWKCFICDTAQGNGENGNSKLG